MAHRHRAGDPLTEGGTEVLQLAWGLVPSCQRGRAAINMRFEGRAFTRGRCLVPATHYFEFTGNRSLKTSPRRP